MGTTSPASGGGPTRPPDRQPATHTGGPQRAHTTFTVPLILVDPALRNHRLTEGGTLADIAPTALKMMGLDKPAAMTGRALYQDAVTREPKRTNGPCPAASE